MSSHVSATSTITDKQLWIDVLQDVFGRVDVHPAPIRVKDYHGTYCEGDLVVSVGPGVMYSPVVVNSATGVVTVDDLNGRQIAERVAAKLGGAIDVPNSAGGKALAALAAVMQFERNLRKKGVKKFERTVVNGKPTVQAFR